MSTTTIVIIAAVVAVVVVLAVIAVLAVQASRRRQLRDQFGPEYERTVQAVGGDKQAEIDLRNRLDRRNQLSIRPLSAAQRERYDSSWGQVQAAFVDAPSTALGQADVLITTVMSERGYPMQDFYGQAELVSVDHPHVVQNYREAHGIYVASQTSPVTTEDMRRAIIAYRALFTELVNDGREPVGRSAGTSGTSGAAPGSIR